MLFSNKSALFFDLDGTLIDSAPDLALSINKMLIELKRPTFSTETIRAWVGNGAQVLTARALAGGKNIDNVNSELLAQALTVFLQDYTDNVCVDTILYPKVKATLLTLKSLGYRLVIITNKPERFIAPILTKLGLDNVFELLLGGDTLAQRKPDPLPLVHACQLLNLDVAKCVMIGDSKNDILAAKAINMQSVGVTYGYNYDESIDLYQPDLVLDCFSQLLTALSPSKQ